MAHETNAEQQASNNASPVSEAESTSVGLPPIVAGVAIEPRLSDEERVAVSSLPPGSALLIAHRGPNEGARFLLDQDVVVAGRHPSADVFLDDVTVSRAHAEFRRDGEGYVLVDTNSLNGTYVNSDRVDTLQLKSGAEMRIGKFILTYYAAPVAPAATEISRD